MFGQRGSLTCGLEVMTTSSTRHARKGDPSRTVVLTQLLTMAKIPGNKTSKDTQEAQVYIAGVCMGVCLCVYLAVLKPFLAFVTS